MSIPDADSALLAASLLCGRIDSPSTDTVRRALEAALELAGNGERVPPLGFLADLAALVEDGPSAPFRTDPSPFLSASLARRYEDDVLAKLATSASFDRAAAALSRTRGRDRARGLAFLAANLLSSCEIEGADVRTGTVRSILELKPDELIRAGQEFQRDHRITGRLASFSEKLCDAFRQCGDLPTADAVFELERGTAFATFSQRLALRHLLHAATAFEAELAERPHRESAVREVATPHTAEDEYPVGGFASISTRGSLESLLHSQLAFMETDERPDLFDVKFARDELLYYSRDENEIRRQRTNVVFVFHPNLAEARTRDAALPWQRLIAACGLIVALIRRLTEWHSSESLHFDLVFLRDSPSHAGKHPLAPEHELLALVLQDFTTRGEATLRELTDRDLASHCRNVARTVRTHRIDLSTAADAHEEPFVSRSQWILREGTPVVLLADEHSTHQPPAPADPRGETWPQWRHTARVLAHELLYSADCVTPS